MVNFFLPHLYKALRRLFGQSRQGLLLTGILGAKETFEGLFKKYGLPKAIHSDDRNRLLQRP